MGRLIYWLSSLVVWACLEPPLHIGPAAVEVIDHEEQLLPRGVEPQVRNQRSTDAALDIDVVEFEVPHELEAVGVVDNQQPVPSACRAEDLREVGVFAVFRRTLKQIRPGSILDFRQPPEIDILAYGNEIIHHGRSRTA